MPKPVDDRLIGWLANRLNLTTHLNVFVVSVCIGSSFTVKQQTNSAHSDSVQKGYTATGGWIVPSWFGRHHRPV